MAFDGWVIWEENSCLFKECNVFQLQKSRWQPGVFPGSWLLSTFLHPYCLFLVSFFFLLYTVENCILMITEKNCYSLWVKNVSDNSLTRLREEMITRQLGNWGLSSGNTINMVKSKLSLTHKTCVQSMCWIVTLLYYLLVVCTCVVSSMYQCC